MGFFSTYEALPDSVKAVLQVLVRELEPCKIALFGSRARGDHRENSDFDIAVWGEYLQNTWTKTLLELEEAPNTLYSLDIVDFPRLDEAYQENVLKEAKVLYERDDQSKKCTFSA